MKFEGVMVETEKGTQKKIIIEKQEINISPAFQKKMRIRKKIQELSEDGLDIYSLLAGVSDALIDVSNGLTNSEAIQKFKDSHKAIKEIVNNTK